MIIKLNFRNRIRKKDNRYLLRLIRRNLGHYPSAQGLSNKRILELMDEYTRVILFTTPSGERVGFLSWTEKENILFLELCVLEERYQGKGIATSYLKRLEKYALGRKFNTLQFYVDKQNNEAYELYKRFGFYPIPTPPQAPTILMEKKLL
ncbi:GNAT family N-acetyltransferase [Ammoniphilus sp. CFH 90114]|uniref:GNAT family N-acetyltransferase n=1 Tax=Ammoniphilus sp. CFH 90114 TaxID=2493665 RepID=UPI00100FF015|nr:GNAT family N-acetyltransferase [Ammoniphilus sp. CFH 90114]RXT13603.1 GNAT family N-acetyltransferase [Ammoniphilus sp. CFH 90114]